MGTRDSSVGDTWYTRDESSDRFKELVLEWMNNSEPAIKARRVEAVRSSGSAFWDGDTEGGFRSGADTYIRFIDDEGQRRDLWLEGDELAGLWQFVMRQV